MGVGEVSEWGEWGGEWWGVWKSGLTLQRLTQLEPEQRSSQQHTHTHTSHTQHKARFLFYTHYINLPLCAVRVSGVIVLVLEPSACSSEVEVLMQWPVL